MLEIKHYLLSSKTHWGPIEDIGNGGFCQTFLYNIYLRIFNKNYQVSESMGDYWVSAL